MVNERRYDIDLIRVITIALLLIYHIAIEFQPWGVFIGFIQSNNSLESIWVPMSMLNIWRIPLLFYVSGMGVAFAIRRRDFKGLIKERTMRILVPFVFGVFALVPLHVFLWQDYYSQPIGYWVNPYHLWFLGNIYIYVLVLSPLFFFFKSDKSSRLRERINSFFAHPLSLIVPIIPFVLQAELVSPDSFETYAQTMHGFWLGLLAFVTGFILVTSGQNIWNTLKKYAWVLFAIAFAMYLVRVIFFELRTPDYLMAIESNIWVFAVFGLGYKYLNKPSANLSYWSQAAYPVYILHMFFMYLSSYVIFGLGLNPWLELLLVIIGTFAGCLLTYEFIVRRIQVLRVLFGLKVIPKKEEKLILKVQET